jgi:polyisoprenoid-binding protein YceI
MSRVSRRPLTVLGRLPLRAIFPSPSTKEIEMSRFTYSLALSTLLAAVVASGARADDYAVDPGHSTAVFRVSHLGLSWTYGRFKDVSGSFSVDPQNPSGGLFYLTARVGSIDTDNAKRNEHLTSPDFFDAAQYPTVSFKSASVKPVEGGYEVAGDLTLHGVSKPLTVILKGGRSAEFPKGVQRTGYVTEFTIKRSDFGMDKMVGAVGDKITVELSFEGTKQ